MTAPTHPPAPFLSVAGVNRSEDLLAQLDAAAASRSRRPRFARRACEAADALALRDTPDEAAFLDHWIALLDVRHQVDTSWTNPSLASSPPRGAAARSALFARSLLWKLLRPLLDALTLHQNDVNARLTRALQWERAHASQRLAAMERRIAQLEQQPHATPPTP